MEKERRKYKRVPAISIVKETMIESKALKLRREIPAIFLNLSAGGMALITFLSLPRDALISLNFNLDKLKLKNVEGRVVRVEGRKKTYLIVIAFTKIKGELRKRINRMADAFDLCDTRILMGEKDVCSIRCPYYELCSKPVKMATGKAKS
jgi:c-di-GMP-binding flagellar brake protein YcgR